MVVPRLALAVPALDVPHATLGQAAGDQHLTAMGTATAGPIDPVHGQRLSVFAVDVERLGGLELHPVGQLK